MAPLSLWQIRGPGLPKQLPHLSAVSSQRQKLCFPHRYIPCPARVSVPQLTDTHPLMLAWAPHTSAGPQYLTLTVILRATLQVRKRRPQSQTDKITVQARAQLALVMAPKPFLQTHLPYRHDRRRSRIQHPA